MEEGFEYVFDDGNHYVPQYRYDIETERLPASAFLGFLTRGCKEWVFKYGKRYKIRYFFEDLEREVKYYYRKPYGASYFMDSRLLG